MKKLFTILLFLIPTLLKAQDSTKFKIKIPEFKYNIDKSNVQDFKKVQYDEFNSLYFTKDIFYLRNNSYICGYGFYSPIEGSEVGLTFCMPIRNKKNR